MTRQPIPFDELLVRAHHLWAKQGLLLTSGDFAEGHFNAMTVGWGSLGRMWGRPFAQVVVRPIRYTHQFMERYDTFTLCAFPEDCCDVLQFMGTKSGRDVDKIAETGLTPVASTRVAAPGFAEAELIIECRKIYWDDMDPAHFLDPDIERHYPQRAYHRIYFGQIVAIWGENSYRAKGGVHHG
jgi:flavin reductase (DIM6/NTAB) family NADH-FMN oxidoreductase RutF